MSDIKLVKLPNSIDPNILIKKEIHKRYSKCPCCGEDKSFCDYAWEGEYKKGIIRYAQRSWYGKYYEGDDCLFHLQNLNPRNWIAHNHHWKVNRYECYSCGAIWECPPYPADIISDKEADKLYKKILGEE